MVEFIILATDKAYFLFSVFPQALYKCVNEKFIWKFLSVFQLPLGMS